MAASVEKCLVSRTVSCINSNFSSANTTPIPCNVTLTYLRDIYGKNLQFRNKILQNLHFIFYLTQLIIAPDAYLEGWDTFFRDEK